MWKYAYIYITTAKYQEAKSQGPRVKDKEP